MLPWNLTLHLVWTDHYSYCTCELLQQERKTQSTTLGIMEQESTDIFYVIIHDLNSMSLLGPDCTAIVSLFLRFAESGQTDQAFISGESSSAFPWNWEDKVKPQGLCSTQKPRTFIFLHQLCNLPLSFQWLCVCIFSLRFFSIWISSVWSSACWISRLFLLFCFCHRCLYVRLWRCTNKKTHLRHGMTKDTCISISVLAKKPGSVVLPPLFKKNNKKVFFFYCVASLVSPPLRYIPASLHTKVLPQAACHLLLTFSE